MSMPRFTADASLYMGKASYRISVGALSKESGVFAATGTCKCTDPKCTFSCPTPEGGFCHRGTPSCVSDCLRRDAGDPYGEHNCSCCCTGNPPHTCVYL
jgi:hypothetical protein